jgi:predicted RNase H-like HicB family nuclease
MNNDKNLNIQEYALPVTIKEEEDGFIATCPLWQDCYAQGDTVEEALNEISYVASSLIELYKEEGMKVPLKLKGTSEQKTGIFNINIPVIVSAI